MSDYDMSTLSRIAMMSSSGYKGKRIQLAMSYLSTEAITVAEAIIRRTTSNSIARGFIEWADGELGITSNSSH